MTQFDTQAELRAVMHRIYLRVMAELDMDTFGDAYLLYPDAVLAITCDEMERA